jgi:hypothetical protein
MLAVDGVKLCNSLLSVGRAALAISTREVVAERAPNGQSGAMAALYPVHEFAEVVALLVGAVHEDDADLSMVKINRSERGLYITFETRSAQAFFGPGRTTASGLRNAMAEKLGDPNLQLSVIRPGSNEPTP